MQELNNRSLPNFSELGPLVLLPVVGSPGFYLPSKASAKTAADSTYDQHLVENFSALCFIMFKFKYERRLLRYVFHLQGKERFRTRSLVNSIFQ